MLNILIIISTLTVFFSLFILRTKVVEEWSLLAASYGFFLLFVLYWKSGNGKLDTISTSLLFLGAFCGSFYQVMGKFCLDFIFQAANKGMPFITFKQVYNEDFETIFSGSRTSLITRHNFDGITRFKVKSPQKAAVNWHYGLDFDTDLSVTQGRLKITYLNESIVYLDSGGFLVIRKKEIHKFEVFPDTIFTFCCRK